MKALEESSAAKRSSSLIRVRDILVILKSGHFYRHMIKFNTENDVTVALVNNRFTEINVRVIIAALLVFASKKLKYLFDYTV